MNPIKRYVNYSQIIIARNVPKLTLRINTFNFRLMTSKIKTIFLERLPNGAITLEGLKILTLQAQEISNIDCYHNIFFVVLRNQNSKHLRKSYGFAGRTLSNNSTPLILHIQVILTNCSQSLFRLINIVDLFACQCIDILRRINMFIINSQDSRLIACVQSTHVSGFVCFRLITRLFFNSSLPLRLLINKFDL